MMKLVSWLSLLLIFAFALSGCASIVPTMVTTQTRQPPSLTIPPATATIIPTLTMMSAITDPESIATHSPTMTYSKPVTPTPIDTLDPEIAKSTIEPLLWDPLNCAVPCFWGIIPGQTLFIVARTLFSRLGFTPFEGFDPNSDRDFYTISYEASIGRDSSITLFPSDHRIANIVIKPDIVKQNEGSPREWIAYSPETLIQKYGKPSRVEFVLGLGQNLQIVMILYFDDSDLIVLYSGYDMIPDHPHSPRVCPLTAPFDHVRLWMGPDPPNPPTMGTVPLEHATSLNVDQFTQLMLGDPQQACFELNGDAFQ